jgi:hypothetical protein
MRTVTTKGIFLTCALMAFFLAVGRPAFAHGPGWTEPAKITSYVVVHDGGVNVALGNTLSNCVSNSGYGGTYASLYPSHRGFKSVHAALLSAFLTGKSVRIYMSDNTCRIEEVRIFP